ncbi:UDP-3-O-(3-hydroxymyristoyl)glucosamine N-acyltransferase [uncultured Umboniibacter sp.]|uniref:UDP-3-O-(3-hydroxymyristoyl)glucosamine N-acyltransferase n=1 Tax=uncultured Umboniibacter sp. TaxID=1798917 RepID=UPI00263550A1|nr:UDP-3-O-(3-hydroxymyristoyl)glucosamine N-acyltransferase [uncultured Umboniibacter sp.]
MEYSLKQLASIVGGSVQGDDSYLIQGLATLQSAGPCHLSFLANAKYTSQLASTSAGAVILNPASVESFVGNALVVDDAYVAFAKLTHIFEKKSSSSGGVHPSAVIAGSAKVSPSALIGPNVVVGENVVIGENTVLGANVVIGDESVLGDSCEIKPNVVLYHGVRLGHRVRIHSGSVIGSDGFGFAPMPDGWFRICQLGGVIIGNNVDIGANTCIDRGALDDTEIADDVIIDNLVQIAHNVKIGRYTAIAGAAGVAGSTVVGERCTLAGGAGIVGHLQIADNVHITASTMVTKSITEAGSYSSGTPMMPTSEWRKNAVRFSQLKDLALVIKKLDK